MRLVEGFRAGKESILTREEMQLALIWAPAPNRSIFCIPSAVKRILLSVNFVKKHFFQVYTLYLQKNITKIRFHFHI